MTASAGFAFVLAEGFTMQAFSSAVEVLRLASKLRPEKPVEFCAASVAGGAVRASNGFRLLPDADIDDIPPLATVVLVAGADATAQPSTEIAPRLRRWYREGRRIWGVSSGVVPLVRSGLLDGRTIAAHWEDVPYIRENHPKVDVTTPLYVLDGRIGTCAGGNAAADMMLNELARLHGPDFVDEIISRLLLDGVRDGRVGQNLPADIRFATANAHVFRALRLMRSNLFDPLSVAEIARRSDLSQRQLERLFMGELGRSPGRVYAELRLSEARQDVLNGNSAITEIALDYGFSIPNFSKTYKRVYGLLPSRDRALAQPKRSKPAP